MTAIVRAILFFILISVPAGFEPGAGQAMAACSDAAEPEVDWNGCRKRNLIISGQDFTNANLSRVDFSSSDLRDVNVAGADVSKSNLVRSSLKGAQGQGADFSNVVAARTDFSQADFSKADFSKAETTRVDFSQTNLSGSDLSKAEFPRAKFEDADLTGVNFDNTNLARSDFRDVKFSQPPSMENTFLFLTRFEGVDLSGVQNLAQWQINLACGDKDTLLPANLQVPDSWPCAEED